MVLDFCAAVQYRIAILYCNTSHVFELDQVRSCGFNASFSGGMRAHQARYCGFNAYFSRGLRAPPCCHFQFLAFQRN
jgi:hypothetical protein